MSTTYTSPAKVGRPSLEMRLVLWVIRHATWTMSLGVGLLAALTRFTGLGEPRKLIFDELYYARYAYSLLELGYVGIYEGENQAFANGDFSGLTERADRTVHPPLGMWIIALGIRLWGPDPFGWRFMSAVVGTLTVIAVTLIARKLFDSVLWGTAAGVLLALDGTHIVLSRTALLDIFLGFFAVLAFGFIVLDRHRTSKILHTKAAQAREAAGLAPDDPLPGTGPAVGIRWYRYAALASLGLAVGVKWSGLYVAAFLMVLSVIWDLADRHAAGIKKWFASAIFRSALPAFLATLLIIPGVYLATWSQWLATPDHYDRQWGVNHPDGDWAGLPDPVRSLVHSHETTWDFHTGLTNSSGVQHSYESKPTTWLLQLRPTAFHYRWETNPDNAQELCGTNACVDAITSIGHPLLWAAGSAALAWALWRASRHGDMHARAFSWMVLAGWVPWFLNYDRVVFTFYMAAVAPFMVLLLIWALKRIAQPPDLHGAWSRTGGLIVGGFFAAYAVIAAFYYPMWVGQTIPRGYWDAHIWVPDVNFARMASEEEGITGTIGRFLSRVLGPKIGWI